MLGHNRKDKAMATIKEVQRLISIYKFETRKRASYDARNKVLTVDGEQYRVHSNTEACELLYQFITKR